MNSRSKTDPELLLYHGSAYHAEHLLRPGIHYTKSSVMWDETESNEYLYFSPDVRDALLNAIAGWITKNGYLLDRFQYSVEKKTLRIECTDRLPTQRELNSGRIYCHTFRARDIPGLQPVHNAHNGMEREFKTNKPVPLPNVAESFAVERVLLGYSVTIVRSVPSHESLESIMLRLQVINCPIETR